MLSKEQVEHIAKLARIALLPSQSESYQKDLSKILAFIAKLKKVEAENVEPAYHSIKISNVFREDDPGACPFEDLSQKMIDMAPAKEARYVKVKAVFS